MDKGIEAKFIIVGFNDDLDNSANFIPVNAGTEIFERIYNRQLDARTSKVLPEASYGRMFGGMRVASDRTLVAYGAENSHNEVVPPVNEFITSQVANNFLLDSAGIYIPGWVYSSSEIEDIKIPSEVSDLKISPESFAISDIIAILDDSSNRLIAINNLIDSGFPEIQNSSSIVDQARIAKEGLVKFTNVIAIILTSISVMFLISLVWRYVSDSHREIGIYRALGARKTDIGFLYIIYTSSQVIIGTLLGLLVGLAFIRPLANHLVNIIYDSNIIPSLSPEGAYLNGLQLTLVNSDLYFIDYSKIALYVAILIMSGLLASLIPAWRAANISPVEAIRNSE